MTSIPNSGPQRRQFEQWPLLAQARNKSKAVVRLGEWPPETGKQVVVKDISGLPLWFRVTYGRHVLHREWLAMVALAEVPEVPMPLYCPDRDSIVMEFRPGQPAHKLPTGPELDALLTHLTRLVHKFHGMGITHGDLHRNNILRGQDGELTLIDWATSSVYGERPTGLRRWIFNEFRSLDLRAVAKIKAEAAPHLLDEAEVAILSGGGSSMYRWIKKVRFAIRRALGKKSARKKDYSHLSVQEKVPNSPEGKEASSR